MNSESNIKSVVENTLLKNKLPDLEGFSRDQLEEEIQSLRATVEDMKSNPIVRTSFGFLRPEPFIERANEEFARSRRYNTPLTLVVVTMMGHDQIRETLGEEAISHYVSKLAEKCKNSCREGADILGMVGPDKFGILLPEANIEGCTRFKERMKDELAASTITWKNSPVKSGLKISAGVLLEHDKSFGELFERTTQQKVVLDQKVA